MLQSGSEQGTTNKRLNENNSTALIRDENGEIDYKKLWEQSQIENDRLREKLRKQDDELRDTKTTLEKISTVVSSHYFLNFTYSLSVKDMASRIKPFPDLSDANFGREC